MSAADFPASFAMLIQNEGGFTVDNGGATRWGVTEAVARKHGYTGDMHDLPLTMAQEIAKAEYWDAVRGDELDPRLGFQMLDAAYNSGPDQAIRWLQRVIGAKADGDFGPVTMAAVKAFPSMDRLIGRFNAARLIDMTSFSAWAAAGKGWARRIANNILRGM